MHDDPFARAVERAKATERAEADARRRHIQREVSGYVSHGARTAFRVHASVFLAVNLLLVVIWATTSPGYPWFLYPFFGWGIGLVAHYAATSGLMNSNRRRSQGSGRSDVAQTPAPAAPAPTPAPASAPAAAPQPSGGSTSDELSRLSELHQSGVLTDKEFKAAKAKLLG